jgi:molybdenum cofactor biosynthesis protein B
MAYDQHKSSAQSITARCAVITLSDTRTEQTDTSGQLIRRLLTESAPPHEVRVYQIIKDDPATLSMLLEELLQSDGIDAVVTNGGTGIARRDQTIDVVQRTIETPLPGFGELFRMLSWQQIGPGAMISRAVAGIARGKPLFAMPGSSKAVELAMTKLILPELRHILHELRK